MNDEQFRLHELAIRERRKFLELVFSKNGSQPEKAGLVALSRVIFLFATRLVMRPEWPEHDVSDEVKLGWEIRWYSDYLQALGELMPSMQAALRAGRITPRGPMTGAPLALDRVSSWLDLNPMQSIGAGGRDFWINAAPSPMGAGWADAEIMPAGVCVALGDVATWAEAEGIASCAEVAALLGAACAPQKETPAERKIRIEKFVDTKYAKGMSKESSYEDLATIEKCSVQNIKNIYKRKSSNQG
jgi:hypothetical protein